MGLLELIRSLKKGDHICYINYENTKSIDYYTAFIKVGLERNEQCIFLAYETPIENVKKELYKFDIDVDYYIGSGQLILEGAVDFYFKSGDFTKEEILLAWEEAVSKARDHGWQGLRVIGEAGWATEDGLFEKVMEYEQHIHENAQILKDCIAICQYRVNQCTDTMIKTILSNHTHTFYDNGSSVSMFKTEDLLQSNTIRFLHESIRDKARLNRTCRHLTVANGLTSQTLHRKGPKYMAEKAIEYLAKENGAQVAVSVFLDRETNRVRYTCCYGVSLDIVIGEIAGPTIKNLLNYAKRVFPCFSEEVDKEPMWELWHQNDIKCLAIIPLQNGRSISGITFMGWTDTFMAQTADLEILTYFLSTVNMALDVHYIQEKTYKKKKDAEKLEALGTLVSGIAHEFNNILAVILGNCQLLQLKSQDSNISKYITDTTKAAQDAANIVRRIQNYSRPKATYERGSLNINSLLVSALEFTRTKWMNEAVAKGNTVQVETRLNCNNQVYANESELREVFINLILNSTDALVKGGHIVISTEDMADQVIVTISDNGIGMSPEELEKAFDPFYTTKYDRGTGLGLTITRNIILAHNGEITVDSEKNKGTVFTIKLPRNAINTQIEKQSITPVEPLKINVVDDDEQVLDAVCSQLTSLGHKVSAFNNGYELIEQLEMGQVADLVITDLAMPGINGVTLANRIKELEVGLPVILMTGWFDGTRNFLNKEAIAGILYKPFNMYDLQKQIEEVRTMVS